MRASISFRETCLVSTMIWGRKDTICHMGNSHLSLSLSLSLSHTHPLSLSQNLAILTLSSKNSLVRNKSFHLSLIKPALLVSNCSCNKLPLTLWLKTTQIYYLLEVSLKSKMSAGFLEAVGETLSLSFPVSFFLSFFLCLSVCGIIVPLPGTEFSHLALNTWSPNHWTAREFPPSFQRVPTFPIWWPPTGHQSHHSDLCFHQPISFSPLRPLFCL